LNRIHNAGVAFEGRALEPIWSDPSGLRATLGLSNAPRRRVAPGDLDRLIARAGMLLRDAGQSSCFRALHWDVTQIACAADRRTAWRSERVLPKIGSGVGRECLFSYDFHQRLPRQREKMIESNLRRKVSGAPDANPVLSWGTQLTHRPRIGIRGFGEMRA